MNSETTSAGAAVLLEGASMVTLTEGGKMALQAYIYEGKIWMQFKYNSV